MNLISRMLLAATEPSGWCHFLNINLKTEPHINCYYTGWQEKQAEKQENLKQDGRTNLIPAEEKRQVADAMAIL